MKKIVINLLTILLIGIIIISIINIDTTKAASTTLADKVISIWQTNGSQTSWSSGASGVYQTNGHEYRYVGANVNNYVSFNNDLYRIIGVFDSNSTGVSGNLVKLIRARSIGGYTWGVTNASPQYTTRSGYDTNWETANVNILLNEYFLNKTDTSATYGSCSDWTYYYGITDNANMYKTNDCSYILKYGIPTSTANDYIQPVTWYLKGYSDATYSKQDMYTCERSDQTAIQKCTGGGNNGTYATKVTNKRVGLIYPSDYMYASGYYSSTDTTAGSSQYYGQQNWLYNGGEWTITPKGYDSSAIINLSGIVWLINGGVNTTFGYISNTVRPTFYLKSSVQYVSGSGSFSDPFIISCDTCNN